MFVGGAVAFGVIAAVAGSFAVHAGWDDKRSRMQAVAASPRRGRRAGPDRVMSIDASGYRYWTGHPGVVLVNDPLATVEEVARAYDIRWLVLERADSRARRAGDPARRPAPGLGGAADPPVPGRLRLPGVHHRRRSRAAPPPGWPRDRTWPATGRTAAPMTRREAWLTALGIFVVALVVRIAAASAIGFPKPEDTAYYVGVARNLAEGRGLVSDALWSYGTPPLEFPRPAFEVWLPLPSLLAAIPIALFAGPAPIPLEAAMRAAQVVPVLAGAILAVLAWRLAADVALERRLPAGRARTLAIGTGLTAAVYLPLVLHSALPDSTMLFGALALGACLLMTRVLRDPRGARFRDPRLLAIGAAAGRRRAHPQRGGLAGGRVGLARVAPAGPPARRAAAPDRGGGGGQPGRVRPLGHPRHGGVREPAARARRSPTRCR